MRLTDLLVLPVAALWQQKGRTVLTTLGVVFGAFVLAASLSINHGIQETIVRESSRNDILRRISVQQRHGERKKTTSESEIVVEGRMSDEKRQRIRKSLAEQNDQPQSANTTVLLIPETLTKLAAIEHVKRVEPVVEMWEFAEVNGQSQRVMIASLSPWNTAYQQRLVAGRLFTDADEPAAVVSEFLLYRCGIRDDSSIEEILGQKIKIEIRPPTQPKKEGLRVYLGGPEGRESTPAEREIIANINRRLPELIKQIDLSVTERLLMQQFFESRVDEVERDAPLIREFKIVGVIRQLTEQELKDRRSWEELGGNADVLLPCQTAADFYFLSPQSISRGLNRVQLTADDEEHVKAIAQQVKELGLHARAPLEFIERERFIWRLVFGGMTCVAAVALLVAAMGIANTMLMSVLERTREIGIMKSVGAAGSQILVIFLIEGLLIGAAGGTIGMLLAWAASYPADAWVRSMVERDINIKLHEALFVFPPWLVVIVVIFAVIVTTIAAVYPAYRAAKIDPVIALRHE